MSRVEQFLDGRVTLHCGDVIAVLRTLPDDHFDCVVTSPPYWGLRNYNVAGQLGLERSLGEHLAVMVNVFREVRRVMKPAASLWLNYGDCYATSPNGRSAADTKAAGNDDRTFRDKPFSTVGPIYVPDHESGDRRGGDCKQRTHDVGDEQHRGRVVAGGTLKPKDLCMVPNRLAISLQEDGWWVRSEIIWGKTNPMPDSSGRYRPSTAHEKIWLLTKSAKSFYDSEAVAIGRSQHENSNGYPGSTGDGVRKRTTVGNVRVDKQRGHSRRHQGFNDRWDQMDRAQQCANGRLLRNYEPAELTVWPIAPQPFPESHFATFPQGLAERCIKAGCPAGGTVLDPFGGSGTTALVAAALGRKATLIELNPEYCVLARARIEAAFMGKDEGARHMAKQLGKERPFEPGSLFGAAP
jgi:DNA modification methylase